MNTGNWTKLYQNTIFSTIWQEPPGVRCVWITMLMMADMDGYVGASVPGLAKAANVELGVTEAALEQFKMPDKYSRSKEHEGRRIVEVEGGWQILNFASHRDGSDVQREKWKLAKRRQRQKQNVPRGTPLPGERAYEKAVERGEDGVREMVVSTKQFVIEQGDQGRKEIVSISGASNEAVKVNTVRPDGSTVVAAEAPEPIPEINSGPVYPVQSDEPPQTESGHFEDGEWVPD